ncbi:MAG: helix-turn-helix domain-containing protein [Lentisphaerae bacterium]|nr:MAG: helix-turn-helix domain-containing protein [Lentisphaerota bacterium]
MNQCHRSSLSNLRAILLRRIRALDAKNDMIIVPSVQDQRRLNRPEGAFGHTHARPELFLQIRGNSHMQFARERCVLPPGKLLIVPAGYLHQEYPEPRNGIFMNYVFAYGPHGFTWHIGESEGRNSLLSHGNIKIRERNQWNHNRVSILCDYLEQIIELFHTQQSPPIPVVNWLMALHLWSLLQVIQPDSSPVQLSTLTSRALQVIHEHLADPELDVRWLAERLNCAADYLSHTFKQHVGIRITRYIHQERVILAKRLFSQTELSVEEIARQCGFRHRGSFHRVFSTITGIAPSRFRCQETPRH